MQSLLLIGLGFVLGVASIVAVLLALYALGRAAVKLDSAIADLDVPDDLVDEDIVPVYISDGGRLDTSVCDDDCWCRKVGPGRTAR